MNESKTIAKHSCKCRFEFDGRECNSRKWNSKCQRECKKKQQQKIMSEIVAYVLVRVIRLVGGLIVTSDGITKKSRNQL